ncbi:MAG: AraC family transcriptional regulator [Candidatus Eisenbacteria bacterium]|nr:AraC family transcriptional regulator [Candidatus Eisenbacteria bacterium]
MRELTVAAGIVRALLEFAVSKGASRDTLTQRSHIDPSDLRDRDQRVSFAKYVALMRAAKELCRDPALALHFGESVPVSEVSLGSVVGAYSDSMAEGLALANRYAPLTIEVDVAGAGDRFMYERGDGEIWIIDRRENPNDFPELTESAFARMVCASRVVFGDQSLLKAVHVTHAEPSYRAEYDRIFQVPVVFSSYRNALLANDSWLTLPPPSPSRPVFDVLKAHSEALLEKLESSKSMRGRVEELLMPSLHDGGATMTAIASQLGVSRQSLFRKLKAEGSTFEEVLDGLHHKLALRYLNGEGLSVKETAFRLGFSEPASFSRAFKRWTGTSPAASRRKN